MIRELALSVASCNIPLLSLSLLTEASEETGKESGEEGDPDGNLAAGNRGEDWQKLATLTLPGLTGIKGDNDVFSSREVHESDSCSVKKSSCRAPKSRGTQL